MRAFARGCTFGNRPAIGGLAAIAAVLGCLAIGAAGPAGASTSKPAAATSGTKSRGVLAGVSCLPARWCMAVGSSNSTPTKAVAWLWKRDAWRQLANPPGGELTGVSCPTRAFCMASGLRPFPPAAVLWNGTKWQAMTPPPMHVTTAPSCPSIHMCAVVNGTGFSGSGAIAETWNGQTWKSWKDSSVCGGQHSGCGAVDVSCASPTMCVLVGFRITSSGALAKAAVWDGSDWDINDPPQAKTANTYPSAVSCTGTFCLVIGDDTSRKAYVALFDATSGTWKNITSSANLPWPHNTCGGACFLPGTLSCASSTKCMTAGLGGFFAWNGSQFRPARPVSAGRGSRLTRVSCVKAFCMAVGHRTVNGARAPLAELWNGRTWKILRTAS